MNKNFPTCEICGNKRYNLVEGFYYCTTCNTQSQLMRETESDHFGAALGQRIRIKDPSRLEAEEKQPSKKKVNFVENGVDMEKIKHWTAASTDDYPRYLYQRGRRLTTFTRLVCQFATTLHRDFDVPYGVKRISLFFVQKYFQYFGIAFCDDEIDLDDDANISLFRYSKTQTELRELVTKKKRAHKKMKKVQSQKAEESQRSDAWNYVSQNQQQMEEILETQNLEIQKALDEQEDSVFVECPTKLSKRATKLAGRIYLEVDLVVAIAFISAQCAGAKWISIWDIFRWYREGRLLVTPAQLRGLGMDIDEKPTRRNHQKRSRRALTGTLPMSDYFRTVLYLAHILPLPPSMPITPFEQVAKRFIFNLNLPMVFLHRINALADLIGIPLNDIGGEFSPSVYPIQSNFIDKLHSCVKMGPRKYFDYVFKNNILAQCFVSLELKVMSLIILSLKLMFGFDGRREYMMKHIDDNSENQNFNIRDWLIQLNLRLAVWRGASIEEVLSPQYLHQRPESTCFHSRVEMVYTGAIHLNKFDYDRCVPARQFNLEKDKHFRKLFTDDFNKPATQVIDTEALFAPLRFQATNNKRDGRDSDIMENERIDSTKQQIFAADYRDYSMNFLSNNDTSYDYKVRSCQHKNEDAEMKEKWLKLFPCAAAYLKYPYPKEMYIIREDPEKFGFTPVMDYTQFCHVFEDSRRFFHQQFSDLINNLSFILGEESEGIYASFLLVQNMFFNSQSINLLKEAMTNGKMVRSGFVFVKNAKNTCHFLNKHAFSVKQSTRSGPTRHFVYGRTTIEVSNKIGDINRLRNWETLPNPAMESAQSATINELYNQFGNPNMNTEGSSTSITETDDDEIFDIDRSEISGSDDDDGETQSDEKEATDKEMEVDNDEEQGSAEKIGEEEAGEADDEGNDEAATAVKNKSQTSESREKDDALNDSDSSCEDDDTTLIDTVEQSNEKIGISTDLALTLLFWRYW